MSVRHWGQGAEPALLLHCTMAHSGAWAGLARHLGDRLSMVAPDLLAHGDGPEADRTRDFHDQATEAAAAHLPEAPAHLIGHSFGATLALRMALATPQRVRSLTLVEPVLFCAAEGPGRMAHDELFAPLSAAMERGDTAEAARIFLGLWGAEAFDDLSEAQQNYITERIWIPGATEPALVDDRAGLLGRMSAVSAPTLLIEGAQSPPVISEINDRLAADIPNVQRARIEDASHMVPITHAGEVARAVGAFLKSL